MRHSGLSLLLSGLLCAGGCTTPPCMSDACRPPPTPPQVFLIAPLQNVVGRSFKVLVNVSGCEIVSQLQLEQGGIVFKTATFKGANTEIEVQPGDIARFYGSVGIAADLTIRAYAICNDGRENRSTPVGIKFFPVASVVEPSNGQTIVLPDSFIAEGGTTSTPATFVGCASTTSGLALVRVDQGGNVVSINQNPPFDCDYFSTISDKNGPTGKRWLFQSGKGIFAFDSTGRAGQDLNITGAELGDSYVVFAVGPDGDAILWDNQASTAPAMRRVRHGNGGTFPNNTVWLSMVPGIVNGTPVVDSTGILLVPSWRVPLGSRRGTQTIQSVSYAGGGNPSSELALISQTFEFLDPANPPQVALTPNGRTIYIVTPVPGSTTSTNVIACGTQGGGGGCVPRWTVGPLPGVVLYLVSFANGTKVAAISANQVWFIDDSSASPGAILNPGGIPTSVSGQLVISGAQVGLNGDFYLLAGSPFATEIIAFDTPTNGEVWRYSTGGGSSAPQSSITMAIDDSGGSWLRIGVNQVRPLSLTEYRTVRGATGP